MWQKKNGHKNSLLPVCSNNRGCLTNGKKPSVSVSEPGTISLLLLGIAGVVLARRLTPTA